MVTMHNSSKRKFKFFSSIKARTIAVVSLGLAIVIQFSTESYMHAAMMQSHNNQNEESTTTSRRRSIFRGSIPVPHRYGFVSKATLRTKRVLHETHPLIESVYKRETAAVRSHPRVISLGEDATTSDLIPVEETTTTTKSRTVQALGRACCSDDPEPVVLDFEKPFLEDCTPILGGDDKPQAHPTCNALHEIHLESDIRLVSTKGSWRTVWTTLNNTSSSSSKDQIALKLLRLNRKFNHETFNAHAMDVMVMDRLSSSPHVMDAHGFCGNSVITDWASSGGRDQVKSYDLRNRERLKIARDLAKGLADVQALRPLFNIQDSDDQRPSSKTTTVFAHNDINIANTVYVDGTIKWNDFNIGVLLRQQKEPEQELSSDQTDNQYVNATQGITTSTNTNDRRCGAPVRFRSDLWRSPEEIRNTSYVHLEQSDMYGFGNILYQIMTRHQPWTHKEPGGQLNTTQVADRKRQGVLPTIPEQYKNTTKTELQTLVLATIACYHPNPAKRPTAVELAKGLSQVYDKLKHKMPVKPGLLKKLFIKH